MRKTPFSLGYRMPAEWEPHEGTWLAWPKNQETFPSKYLEAVRTAYSQMIRALCTGEKVHLLVDDREAEDSVRSYVKVGNNFVFHTIWSADVWVRDYGPIFVKNGKVAATKWRFNAWGDKYADLKPDDETGSALARETGLEVFETDSVLEGGSVDVNGRGLLMTTSQCLLNRSRNPGMSSKDVEEMLRDYLGAAKVIWLGEGISGDDTDGHVDDVARFVAEDTVVCMTEADRNEANHATLAANWAQLERDTLPDGRRLKLVSVQMPKPLSNKYGRLPASYANFYIGNSAVLVPTFRDPNDREALATMKGLFPTRKVVGVDCRALVAGLGTIHCVTQQQPAVNWPTATLGRLDPGSARLASRIRRAARVSPSSAPA